MYGRKLGERLLEFGHEGILYNNSFVLYDRGTKSLWIHTTGQAVKGELRGAQLEFQPSEVVRWKVWKARHPKTLVLDRGGEDQGFMGTFALPDSADNFGVSVGSGRAVTLYPFARLEKARFITDGPRVLLWLPETATVRAFAAGERRLRLDEEGRIADEAGARWDALTGQPLTEGAPALERLPATAWRMDRWRVFFPKGAIYGE